MCIFDFNSRRKKKYTLNNIIISAIEITNDTSSILFFENFVVIKEENK